MTFFGESDIDTMLSESPTQATIGGVTASVFLEPVGEEKLPGIASSVQATRILLTVKTGQFPALAAGVAIAVNGTNYRAADIKRSGDGALTQVLCEIA